MKKHFHSCSNKNKIDKIFSTTNGWYHFSVNNVLQNNSLHPYWTNHWCSQKAQHIHHKTVRI